MLVVGMSFAGVAGAQTTGDTLEPNDSLSDAVDVGSGDAYDGLEISDSEDVDYFAVDVEEGETITANIEFSDEEGDLDLEIQDSDGDYLTSSISVSDDETAEYTASESGTYYVQVYGFSGATADYDIDIETGNPRADATDLGTGGSATDQTISSSSEEDYYAIQADAGEEITAELTFSDDNGDLDMTLEDSAGTYLSGAASVSDDETIEYTVSESGTYYVRVYAFSGAPNDYDLEVGTSDPYADATDLGTGDSATDQTISSSSEEDLYAVQADSGDTITADLTFSDDQGDLDMTLEDSAGSFLDGAYSVSDDETIEYTVTESGTYYVRVYAFSGAPNDYDLTVSTDESGTTTPDGDDDQLSDGPDLRSISFGESETGTIDTDDPTVEGYYHEPVTFDGEEGQAVDIEMTSETGDTYLVLEGPDGEYLTFDDDGGDGLNSHIEGYVLPQTGEYTIIATSYSGESTFNYTLSLDEGEAPEDDDLEPNDDIDSATSLGTGGSFSGLTVSDEYGESDYFSVYAQEGQTITADITFSDDDADLDLEIQDSTGSSLEGSYSVSDDESVEYTAEESGTYYVEVYAFSGGPADYDIDVSTSGSGTDTSTNDDLSLSANATATASGDMEVQFDLENTGEDTQAVILQAGDGVEALGSDYSVSDHSDDGGAWRSSEGSWLFESLESGDTVSPSATVDVPEGAEGTRIMTVTAESDAGTVTSVVELDLSTIGIAQAADTNGNGELEDSEILAAIDAWRTDSSIEGTDATVSDDQIISLISTWRAEGS